MALKAGCSQRGTMESQAMLPFETGGDNGAEGEETKKKKKKGRGRRGSRRGERRVRWPQLFQQQPDGCGLRRRTVLAKAAQEATVSSRGAAAVPLHESGEAFWRAFPLIHGRTKEGASERVSKHHHHHHHHHHHLQQEQQPTLECASLAASCSSCGFTTSSGSGSGISSSTTLLTDARPSTVGALQTQAREFISLTD